MVGSFLADIVMSKGRLKVIVPDLKDIMGDEYEEKHEISIKTVHIVDWFKNYSDVKIFPTCNIFYNKEEKPQYRYVIIENNEYTLPLINIVSCNLNTIDEENLNYEYSDNVDKRGAFVEKDTKRKEEKNDGYRE